MERKEKLQQLLKDDPADNFLQHALALEYIKEGNDAEAKLLFESILERDADYTGSYYHLGKLLERANDYTTAITWYKKGMQRAGALKDMKTYNELQAALEDIADL
ncbi:MAG: hypothetical protein QM763_09655 [Agriterribacter sp.]